MTQLSGVQFCAFIMIRTIGLAHINLNVSDIERSVRFYRDLFGLEVLMDYEGPMGEHPRGRQVALSTPGANDVLALSAIPGVAISAGGMSHFGFTLVSNDDIDDAVLQVLAAGGKAHQAHDITTRWTR